MYQPPIPGQFQRAPNGYNVAYTGQMGQLRHLPGCKVPHPFAVAECTCPASATLGTDTPVERLSLIQYDMMYEKAPLPDHKIRAIRTKLRKLYPDDPRYRRQPGERDFISTGVERAYLANANPDGLWSSPPDDPNSPTPNHPNQQAPALPIPEDPQFFSTVPAREAEKQGFKDIHDPWANEPDSFWEGSVISASSSYSQDRFAQAEEAERRAQQERDERRRRLYSPEDYVPQNPTHQTHPAPVEQYNMNQPPNYQPPLPNYPPPTPNYPQQIQQYTQQPYPGMTPTPQNYPGVVPTGYPPNTPAHQVPAILTAEQNQCRDPHLLELQTPYGPIMITMECQIENRPHPGLPHMANLPSRVPDTTVRIAWIKAGE